MIIGVTCNFGQFFNPYFFMQMCIDVLKYLFCVKSVTDGNYQVQRMDPGEG